MMPILFVYASILSAVFASDASKRLFEDLFVDYKKIARPVNRPEDKVHIRFRIRLSEILDVVERNQVLITALWLHHEWVDEKLVWDPRNYEGVTHLYIPSQMIWIPDTVLYNNADGDYQIKMQTKAKIMYNGTVIWEPPGIYKSQCEIDVQWFPFDEQQCKLKFGLWTYNFDVADFVHDIDSSLITNRTETDKTTGTRIQIQEVDQAVDLAVYNPSAQWSVMWVPGRRHVIKYPGLDSLYIDITYYLVLRRKPLFYTINLIIPSASISILSVFVFHLPTDSGEKMTLCISVLIALSIFVMLLFEIIPATSLCIPMIGRYLMFTLILVAVSIVVTIVTINLHYRSPSMHSMRPWIRYIFIDCLAPRMGIPPGPNAKPKNGDHVEEDSRSELSGGLSDLLSCCHAAESDHDKLEFEKAMVTNMTRRRSHRPSVNLQLTPLKPRSASYLDHAYRGAVYRKLLEDITFIGNHLELSDNDEDVEDEWSVVAMVMDKCMLGIYLVVTIIGSIVIIAGAPTLHDGKIPLRE